MCVRVEPSSGPGFPPLTTRLHPLKLLYTLLQYVEVCIVTFKSTQKSFSTLDAIDIFEMPLSRAPRHACRSLHACLSRTLFAAVVAAAAALPRASRSSALRRLGELEREHWRVAEKPNIASPTSPTWRFESRRVFSAKKKQTSCVHFFLRCCRQTS